MKALKLMIVSALGCYICFAQNMQQVDSLKKALITAKEDTNKVKLLNALSKNFAPVFLGFLKFQ